MAPGVAMRRHRNRVENDGFVPASSPGIAILEFQACSRVLHGSGRSDLMIGIRSIACGERARSSFAFKFTVLPIYGVVAFALALLLQPSRALAADTPWIVATGAADRKSVV